MDSFSIFINLQILLFNSFHQCGGYFENVLLLILTSEDEPTFQGIMDFEVSYKN
jgi:hypothetical protein